MDDDNRNGFDAFDQNYLIEMSNTIFDMWRNIRQEIRRMRDMLDMMFILAIALTILIVIVLLMI